MVHTHGGLVIGWPLVEQLTAVFLCGDRGRQVDGDHLEQGVSRGQPAAHHSLEQWLALLVLVLAVQFDVQLLDQLGRLLLPEVHDGVEHLKDGVQDELAEGAGKFLPVWAIG